MKSVLIRFQSMKAARLLSKRMLAQHGIVVKPALECGADGLRVATYARGGGKTLETARRVDEARAAGFSTLVIGPAAPTPSSFDEAFDREIAAHYDRARAEERAHARPISTLLPIGLPPISVQEILAARDACPIEYLRRAVDEAVEAFVSGDRAELYRILVFALESSRFYRWDGKRERAPSGRYHNAVALIVWRLWRERTP